MSKHKKDIEQTAYTSVGFPTGGKPNVAATDGLSDVVEAIMDNIERQATGEVSTETAKKKK